MRWGWGLVTAHHPPLSGVYLIIKSKTIGDGGDSGMAGMVGKAG